MANLAQNWTEIITPGLTSIFWNGVGEMEMTHERSNVFNVLPSERAFEEHLGIGSLSNNGWNYRQTGEVQFDTIPKLWTPRFDHETFAKGIEIERDLIEDNLYSDAGLPATVSEQPAILGRNAEIQRETAAAEVFNYSQSNSGTTPSGFSVAGPDSSALIATDHELYPGAGSGDDQSNLYSAYALTTASINEMYMDARKWTDNAGNPMGVRLDQLLVPVEFADDADVIRLSQLQPGTANNDANTGRTRLSGGVTTWDYLDATRWFYMDSILRKRLLLWYERRPLDFAGDSPLTQLVGRWRADMRYSRGFVHWAFVAGSVGN